MDEEQAMAAIMGFSSFDSTHGKKIEDNHTTAAKGACAKVFTKSLEWRQYMWVFEKGLDCKSTDALELLLYILSFFISFFLAFCRHRGKALGQRANLEGKIVSRRVNGSGIEIDTKSSGGGGAGKQQR
jgi:U4/U6.U5 small nuclear ribonucleoproteins